jgi:hypothetical protein
MYLMPVDGIRYYGMSSKDASYPEVSIVSAVSSLGIWSIGVCVEDLEDSSLRILSKSTHMAGCGSRDYIRHLSSFDEY